MQPTDIPHCSIENNVSQKIKFFDSLEQNSKYITMKNRKNDDLNLCLNDKSFGKMKKVCRKEENTIRKIFYTSQNSFQNVKNETNSKIINDENHDQKLDVKNESYVKNRKTNFLNILHKFESLVQQNKETCIRNLHNQSKIYDKVNEQKENVTNFINKSDTNKEKKTICTEIIESSLHNKCDSNTTNKSQKIDEYDSTNERNNVIQNIIELPNNAKKDFECSLEDLKSEYIDECSSMMSSYSEETIISSEEENDVVQFKDFLHYEIKHKKNYLIPIDSLPEFDKIKLFEYSISKIVSLLNEIDQKEKKIKNKRKGFFRMLVSLFENESEEDKDTYQFTEKSILKSSFESSNDCMERKLKQKIKKWNLRQKNKNEHNIQPLCNQDEKEETLKIDTENARKVIKILGVAKKQNKLRELFRDVKCIDYAIFEVLEYLQERAICETGPFRRNGKKAIYDQLYQSILNKDTIDFQIEDYQIRDIISMMKKYMRETSIFNSNLSYLLLSFFDKSGVKDPRFLKYIPILVQEERRYFLSEIFDLFTKINSNREITKMSTFNLCTVTGPSFFCKKIPMDFQLIHKQIKIIETFFNLDWHYMEGNLVEEYLTNGIRGQMMIELKLKIRKYYKK